MDAYQIVQIDGSTWAIEEGMVRSYLLAGSEKALPGRRNNPEQKESPALPED